ncbi:MAG TPA: DUF397 domain-containing protein [Streptosporangiaceae bacterium]|nr:DUF397 domain-containing protein [Streptosporangiaceae bacterium]
MSNPDLTGAAWRKSSYSGANGSCVEIAPLTGAALDVTVLDAAGASPAAVAVRDSKDRSGPALVFTTRQWRTFAAGIKNGELDLA